MERGYTPGTWRRALGQLRDELLPNEPLLAILISLFLGVALTASIVDLFIPLLGTRTLLFRLVLMLAAPAFFALLVLPGVGNFLRRRTESVTARERLAWQLALVFLLVLAGFVLAVASAHLWQLASADARQIQRLAGTASPTQFPEMLFLFMVAIFLGIPGTPSINARTRPEARVLLPLVLLAVCFLAIHFLNNVLPLMDTALGVFHFPALFEALVPVGKDFLDGLYRPTQMLLQLGYAYAQPGAAANNYPPLVMVLALPYLLFRESTAYFLHVCLLFIANVACLSLAAALVGAYSAGQSGQGKSHANTTILGVWLLVAFNLLSGYPFIFSLERGNIDIFAMLFSAAAVWLLLTHPERIWWQVLLLSIAVHIKVYPVFLFAALFLANRSKIVLPSILINIAFLFVLGPANALGFLRNVLYRSANADPGIMNGSGFSFAVNLARSFVRGASPGPVTAILFPATPLVIWAVAWLALAHLRDWRKAAVSGFMITIPLMVTLPSVSYDYKLVMLSTGILILLCKILMRMADRQELADYGQLLTISVIALWIGRSYMLTASSLTLFQNKYPWVILLQILMLVNIVQELRQSGFERAPVPENG